VVRPSSLVACAAGLVGCVATPVHRCLDDSDCRSGDTCWSTGAPGSDEQRCARDDAACGSGLRWADDAGDLHGACVEPFDPVTWSPCVVHAVVDQDEPCAREVCTREPRCCAREWSDTCVALADQTCGTACGAMAAFVGGSGQATGPALLSVGEWNGAEFVEIWTSPAPPLDEVVAAVAWGDYDADRTPDLVTCRLGAQTTLEIWHGEPTGWTSVYQRPAGTALCQDLDWVDIDGDGDLDVLAAAAYNAILVEHNADGGWSDPSSVTGLEMGFLNAIDWADLDGDGLLDAAASRYTDDYIVERNTGDDFMLVFDPAAMHDADHDYRDIAWGDADRAGGLDVLLAGRMVLQVVSNTAADGFTEGATLMDETVGVVASAVWVDVDEDGDLDVVALAMGAPLTAYRNDGAGAFGAGWSSGEDAFAATANDGTLTSADVDGDRHVDLVACAETDDCRVWLGDGAGAFTEAWDPASTRPLVNLALTGRRR
jgi:hypothetical protein